MRFLAALAGLLVTACLAQPAAAAPRSALFPSVRASVGTSHRAQRVERRVRAIETNLLGAGHAAEHARQRALSRRLARRPVPRVSPLTADNTLVSPAVGGRWADPQPLPIVAINSILLHTGEVLIFAYPYRPHVRNPQTGEDSGPDSGTSDAYLFDPATGTTTEVTPPINPDTGKPAILFCAGASLLPDGRVLVVGGDVGDPTDAENKGSDTVYTFDPATRQWALQGRTRQGRWYPSQLEMADGRTVIMAGRPNVDDPDWPTRVNKDVELFSPDNTLQALSNFHVDKEDDQPVRPGHAPLPGQYPHLFWMRSGHALVAGPRKTDTWRFFPPTPGADDASWQDVPDLPTYREWSSGVLLSDLHRVMLFGGADKNDHYTGPRADFPAVTSTTIFDDDNPTAGWTFGPNLNVARAFSNSVLLPDGDVAVVGGGTGEDTSEFYRWQFTPADKRVELYHTATGTFTLGNAQAEGRTYHSTALLMPDGRVMSAGDDINGSTGPGTGTKTDTAELWSPPYLFNADGSAAPRPQLLSAPASVSYGESFTAGASGDVSRAVLVAPGSSTHDTDMSQRVVPLADPGHLDGAVGLRAPASSNEAPPGYYMLFLINPKGTPSVARFVHVGPAAPAVPSDPVVTPSPAPAPTGVATAPPSATPSPAPTVAPATFRLSLRSAKPRLSTLRRTRRLRVQIALTRAGTVKLTLVRGRRALMKARTLRFTGAGRKTVTLRVSRARLAHGRTVRLGLMGTARPAGGGGARTARLTLRLR